MWPTNDRREKRGCKTFFQDYLQMCYPVSKKEVLGRGCLPEHYAALEILAEVTSLPEEPERLARVQQLSGCQFLQLSDDCRIRLAELGLKTTDLPETDPE